MDYIEVKCKVVPRDPAADILMTDFSDLGYESFVENDEGFFAYIPVDFFKKDKLYCISLRMMPDVKIYLTHDLIKEQNWNEVWEMNYSPVLIAERCYVRAPFHDSKMDIEFDIIIEPRMSFGTAHHATTEMMIRLLLDENVVGKSVLDMGCGTAVLAILAGKKGAGEITAIDIDVVSYENASDNVRKNNLGSVNILLGDSSLLKKKIFDIILANIHKNVLIEDMAKFVDSLKNTGIILMSGFYEDDLQEIIKCAKNHGMKFIKKIVKNKWVAASFIKNMI